MTDSPVLFDPTDPATALDPFPAYARLREAHPVWRSPASGIWFITRHADVHASWRDKRLGSSAPHRDGAEDFVTDGELPPWYDARYADFAAFERWDLISLEPPDHTQLRRLVAEAFTPRTIERQRPLATRLVAERLESGCERGTLDLVTDLAEPLSLAIICDLIGVPASDRSAVLALSHDVVAMYEPQPSDEQKARANDAAREFMHYTAGLIAERRRVPADDLLSGLLEALIDGERLSDAQVTSTVMLLLMAGHEASVNAAGNGVAAFAAHPDQWESLRSDGALLKPAVEETLRFDPPLQFFRRWVMEHDFGVAGVPVPRGARVGLMIGSANRDPRRYPDPDSFRIARGDASHLSFGGGIHFCLGAPLARLELEVLFGALAGALPRLEVLPGAERRPGFQFRGYTRLPIAPTA